MHISLETRLNKLNMAYRSASPVVRSGAWYVQDEDGRVRYRMYGDFPKAMNISVLIRRIVEYACVRMLYEYRGCLHAAAL
jgi:hypothetical protein